MRFGTVSKPKAAISDALKYGIDDKTPTKKKPKDTQTNPTSKPKTPRRNKLDVAEWTPNATPDPELSYAATDPFDKIRHFETNVNLGCNPTEEEEEGMAEPEPLPPRPDRVEAGAVEYNVPQNKDEAMWRMKERHGLQQRTGYSRCGERPDDTSIRARRWESDTAWVDSEACASKGCPCAFL